MRGLIFAFILGLGLSAFAEEDPNVIVEVLNNNMSAVVSAQYLATVDAIGCRDLVWDGGSPKIIPKRIFQKFEGRRNKFEVPNLLKSHCGFERVSPVSVGITKAGVSNFNVFTVELGNSSRSDNKVSCKEIMSGPRGNRAMTMCEDISIETDLEGNATVEVVMDL